MLLRGEIMNGIKFLVDDKGKRTAVLIDLKKNSGLLEDIFDCVVARRRKNEPRESIESVKQRLRQQGKLPPDD